MGENNAPERCTSCGREIIDIGIGWISNDPSGRVYCDIKRSGRVHTPPVDLGDMDVFRHAQAAQRGQSQ